MSDINFSRMEELTYSDVTKKYSTNLLSLLQHSLETYQIRFLEKMQFCAKEFTYRAIRNKSSISFTLFLGANQKTPSIESLKINSQNIDVRSTVHLENMLYSKEKNSHLNAVMTYKGLDAEQFLSEQDITNKLRKVGAGCLQLGNYSFYFSAAPEDLSANPQFGGLYVLKKIECGQGTAQEIAIAADISSSLLPQKVLPLIKRADNIVVVRQLYADDDPNKYLIHEDFEAIQDFLPSQNSASKNTSDACVADKHLGYRQINYPQMKYQQIDQEPAWCIWKYQIIAPKNYLPASSFSRIKKIFEIIRSDFDESCFKTVRVCGVLGKQC